MSAILSKKSTKLAAWAVPLIVTLFIPGIGALFALASVVISLFVFKEARQPTLALVYRSWGLSILIGVAAGIIIYFAFFYLVEPLIEIMVGSNIDLSSYEAVEGNIPNFLILLAVGILFGGVIEEFIYRGFVIGWGTTLFGERSGILLVFVSGTVFGIAHWYQGIAGVLSTGLIGILLGLIYLATGKKLLPIMLVHMVNNILGVTAIYLGIF